MSFRIPQVFISSTSEFAAERQQLQQALANIPDFDFKAYIYEEDAAGPHSPEKHLMRVLDDSEIVVLILGSTYGTEFPGRSTSIVEWEFEYAREAAKELKGYLRQTPPVHPRQATFITLRPSSIESRTSTRSSKSSSAALVCAKTNRAAPRSR